MPVGEKRQLLQRVEKALHPTGIAHQDRAGANSAKSVLRGLIFILPAPYKPAARGRPVPMCRA